MIFTAWLWLRFGSMPYDRLRFYEDGQCPTVRLAEFEDQHGPQARTVVPFTALSFPG